MEIQAAVERSVNKSVCQIASEQLLRCAQIVVDLAIFIAPVDSKSCAEAAYMAGQTVLFHKILHAGEKL